MQYPAIVEANVPQWVNFATRVHWYAIWVKAYPLSTIHFRFVEQVNDRVTTRTKGFLVEP